MYIKRNHYSFSPKKLLKSTFDLQTTPLDTETRGGIPIAKYAEKFGASLADKMTSLKEQRGIDPRMAATYAQNRQIMGDPRMRGAKGGLAKILGV